MTGTESGDGMATPSPASVPCGLEHSQQSVLATDQHAEPMAGANNRGKVTQAFRWCCRGHAARYGNLSASQMLELPARCTRGREPRHELGRIEVDLAPERTVRLARKRPARAPIWRLAANVVGLAIGMLAFAVAVLALVGAG